MKTVLFIAIVLICSVFFLLCLIVDEEFVSDRPERQIFESALLAIILAIVGISAAKYYGDKTTNDTITGLEKKFLHELEEKVKNLESKFDKLQNSKKSEIP